MVSVLQVICGEAVQLLQEKQIDQLPILSETRCVHNYTRAMICRVTRVPVSILGRCALAYIILLVMQPDTHGSFYLCISKTCLMHL